MVPAGSFDSNSLAYVAPVHIRSST